MEKGYSLVSQQIRSLILSGQIKVNDDPGGIVEDKNEFFNKKLEARVQPASFEPLVGDEVFIIDTDSHGMFRPQCHETVYRTLLQLPSGHRPRKDITGGFELKTGFTYLLPLQEKIVYPCVDLVRSSPKSSTGRVFPKTRMMADFNSSFDDITNFELGMDLWLFVQPVQFNLIVNPGDKLNQLRLFNGDARLTADEVLKADGDAHLLYKITDDNLEGLNLNYKMVIDGMQLTLDLFGENTEGVAGLMARNNPDPIDLSKVDYYNTEEYFEPLVAKNGKIVIERGRHYLFASNEVLNTPKNLSSELRRHSREGIEGSSHDAGFVDPGFNGDLVFEVRPSEETKVVLTHGSPLSRLDFYRTSETPDKVYGEEIHSHYKKKKGPQSSKHFKKFNYKFAAKNIDKLDRIVLVQDPELLFQYRNEKEGFELINEGKGKELLDIVEDGFFHSRYDCEGDESVLQVIPYVVLFGEGNTVFSYVRAEDVKDYGDVRLFGKHSIGVGGHVTIEDGPNFVERGIKREVFLEEVDIVGGDGFPKLVGTLFSNERDVDKVHFGLIYGYHTKNVSPKENAIVSGRMVPISEIQRFSIGPYETWSRLLIHRLGEIKELSK